MFIVGIVILKMWFFVKQNPRVMLGPKFGKVVGAKLLYTLMDTWSEIMFWITFFTSMYWFITFKMQANAYVLLPSVDDWE